MIVIWGLYILVLFYNMVDVYQTKILLDLGSIELNPILNFFMNLCNSWLAIVYVKLFWLGILFILLISYGREMKRRLE